MLEAKIILTKMKNDFDGFSNLNMAKGKKKSLVVRIGQQKPPKLKTNRKIPEKKRRKRENRIFNNNCATATKSVIYM